MAEPIEFRADPGRRRLIRSVFDPSPLEEVAVAVTIASLEEAGDIYVERTKGRYRWSVSATLSDSGSERGVAERPGAEVATRDDRGGMGVAVEAAPEGHPSGPVPR